jgi:hypothetical protein
VELNRIYPLRGRISEVKDTEMEVNIGRIVGTKTGQQYRVVDQDVVLEITSIDKETSSARIVKGTGTMFEGMPIELIQ